MQNCLAGIALLLFSTCAGAVERWQVMEGMEQPAFGRAKPIKRQIDLASIKAEPKAADARNSEVDGFARAKVYSVVVREDLDAKAAAAAYYERKDETRYYACDGDTVYYAGLMSGNTRYRDGVAYPEAQSREPDGRISSPFFISKDDGTFWSKLARLVCSTATASTQ